MDLDTLTKLLREVASGTQAVETALARLGKLPVNDLNRADSGYADLGYANLDHHRESRIGWPEVVFGERKSATQIVGIARAIIDARQDLLVTRVDPEKAELVKADLPLLRYAESARTLSLKAADRDPRLGGPVVLVTAGTSDIDVAEEAAETLLLFGERIERAYDVGVAGIHRLLQKLPLLESAAAIICVAGMEGALPSVLGGLVRCPIVAVPTSVGYGTALQGLTPLFAMLTGCSAGVSVVNIDNGFGAAMAVLRMTTLSGESVSNL